MASIWFRCLCLVALGILLGAASNLFGPKKNRIPWIRDARQASLQAGVEQGDLSTAGMRLVSDKGTANVLDARKAEDYAKGHVPGALSLDVRQFETRFPAVQGRLLLEFPIVIYCGGGDCEDSKELAKLLKLHGYEALIYAGGWEAWSAAGFPAETGEPQ